MTVGVSSVWTTSSVEVLPSFPYGRVNFGNEWRNYLQSQLQQLQSSSGSSANSIINDLVKSLTANCDAAEKLNSVEQRRTAVLLSTIDYLLQQADAKNAAAAAAVAKTATALLAICAAFIQLASDWQLLQLRLSLIARQMLLHCMAANFDMGLTTATQLMSELKNLPERDQGSVVSQLEDCALRISRLPDRRLVADFMLRFIPEISQQLSKVKVAKLVKLVLDSQQRRDVTVSGKIGGTSGAANTAAAAAAASAGATAVEEMQLCNEFIAWADKQRFSYLRQSLQVRLMGLLYETEQFEEALKLGSNLLRELKKLDDKMLLVEVQLMESKTYYKLGNVQRSRAALTSSRTTANGIYIPPRMQANLDLQSGILHAADERDFKTAYSYFYESFEGFDSIDLESRAVNALKYMLMCKIILNLTDEVSSILSGKLALKYASYRDVQAMTEIAASVKKRSLADFVTARESYKCELDEDYVVRRHLAALYDSLVERNLIKLIEPYSRVQIDHIASLIRLPRDVVEKKMSQMILDKSLNGILDQETGVLVMYQHQEADETYLRALDTIHEMSKVIDQLYVKSRKLN